MARTSPFPGFRSLEHIECQTKGSREQMGPWTTVQESKHWQQCPNSDARSWAIQLASKFGMWDEQDFPPRRRSLWSPLQSTVSDCWRKPVSPPVVTPALQRHLTSFDSSHTPASSCTLLHIVFYSRPHLGFLSIALHKHDTPSLRMGWMKVAN